MISPYRNIIDKPISFKQKIKCFFGFHIDIELLDEEEFEFQSSTFDFIKSTSKCSCCNKKLWYLASFDEYMDYRERKYCKKTKPKAVLKSFSNRPQPQGPYIGSQ